MSEKKTWRPSGVQLAFREGVDGFVYCYLTDDRGMEDAIELCRARKLALEGDPILWRELKASMAAWLARQIAAETGLPLEEVRMTEGRPKDERA